MTSRCSCPICTTYRWRVLAHKVLYVLGISSSAAILTGCVLALFDALDVNPWALVSLSAFSLIALRAHDWLGNHIRDGAMRELRAAAEKAGVPVPVFIARMGADSSRPGDGTSPL